MLLDGESSKAVRVVGCARFGAAHEFSEQIPLLKWQDRFTDLVQQWKYSL